MTLKKEDVMSRFAVTVPSGGKITYAPFGAIISEDGTAYILTQQFSHGIICALLFPELTKECGYAAPDRDASVFEYQRFELGNQNLMPVVRVALGITGLNSISASVKPITDAQLMTLQALAKALGWNGRTPINTNYGGLSLQKTYNELKKDHTNDFEPEYLVARKKERGIGDC